VAPVEDVRYGLSLSGVDPASLTRALTTVATQLARRPTTAARLLTRFTVAQLGVALDVARTTVAGDGELRVRPDRGDKRFDDRAWTHNPVLRGLLESYLVTTRAAQGAVDELELPEATRRKAHFALGVVLDALAPSNVPWINPAVVKEAYDTGGRSMARGATLFLEDLVRNGGQPSPVDTSSFELGRNLAATPGRVVFRNDLIELLAYEPTTARVRAQPIVYSPPWINKYYVLDLSPGRSFIEFAVAHGFTVFAISYRNPDRRMASLTLDDYVRDGLLAAVDQASELTGSPKVNLVSVCVGGTLAAIALAVLATRGERDRIGWATFLNSLVDFAEPGDISVFTDEESVAQIERRVRRRGYMEEAEISGPFTLMKGNDLIWRYVVSNWQMGRRPEPFDILAWNADATRLPAMHVQYLRACYLRNDLTRPGALEVDGTPVNVSLVTQPLYVLGAQDDHIVPWRSAYRTTQVLRGRSRFVLTSGGHIAGMVNPPGKARSRYWTQDATPADADVWLAGAEEREGSWWEDWSAWASRRSGRLVAPPRLPEGDPAPGRYVRS
jgi:polyhydroxyalkanoate synthase